jgi:hypothetical protein
MTSPHPADPAIQTLQALRAERALFSIAAQAIDASQRPFFDADYGSYTGHPMDPRSPCDCCNEVMTADEARGEATDQILSFAESVADWMAKACDCDEGRMPLDVRDLEPLQIIEGSPALLVACLMNGDNSQVLRAVHKLREMAAKNFATEIDERAAELLAAAL